MNPFMVALTTLGMALVAFVYVVGWVWAVRDHDRPAFVAVMFMTVVLVLGGLATAWDYGWLT